MKDHSAAWAIALFLFSAGCASNPPPAEVSPRREIPAQEQRTAGLPPVPEARGELRIDVVYPGEGAAVAVSDSTFIFGNIGRGDATLTINGAPVDVAPNGAWLAFLPVPANGAYQLTASAAGQTVTSTRNVRVPGVAAAQSASSSLAIIPGSITPAGVTTGLLGERVEVRFRGTHGAAARLVLPDGTVVPLTERQAIDRSSGFMLDRAQANAAVAEYVGSFPLSSPIVAADTAIDSPTLTDAAAYESERARPGFRGASVELSRGAETVRLPLPAAIGVVDPMQPRVAVAATARPDSIVIGRRALGADQAWDFFWPNGTVFAIDGEAPGFYRVRLTSELTAWVAREDVRLLPAGIPAPRGFVGPSIQLTPRGEWVDVRFSTSERVPFRVEPRERGLSITFYGATGRPAYVSYGANNEFVETVTWDQPTDELFRFDVNLDRPLWGYRYRWDGSSLVLQVRRPPDVDLARPLAGLRVAVDAGHRASVTDTGAIGPTRLTEAEGTLAVVQRLIPMLERAGAEIVHIRTDTTSLPLVQRPVIADAADAHLFFSVHFNAFPDGVNPFDNQGTINFYYWPQSLGLARHMQREILDEFGLPDRGVRYQNLGITRTTWMPTVLTETLFLMFPEQEAAVRTPEVQERIAAAHMRALEGFVRDQAEEIEE